MVLCSFARLGGNHWKWFADVIWQDMRDEDLGILSMMHGANITKSKARWP